MLICTKCGNQNPLGRVFCMSCGSKLDLTNMSSEVVEESEKPSFIKLHWPKFVLGVRGVALLVVVVALWPDATKIGEEGTPVAAKRVGMQLSALTQVRPGRPVKTYFAERDINGFLAELNKSKNLGAESITVDVGDGFFTVHVVKPFTTLSAMGYSWTPKYSCELVCIPVQNVVRVSKAKFGHLPLVGGTKSMAIKRVVALLSGQKEWEVVRTLQEVKAEDGKITIVVKR